MKNSILNILKTFLYILIILSSALFFGASYAYQANTREGKVTIEGYVSHGVNIFNNQFIADYSKSSPLIPFLNPNPPVYEIGVFSEGAFDSEVITNNTELSRLVATNRRFVDLFGIVADPKLFNQTLDHVGSNYFGFQGNSDRIIPLDFYNSGEALVYRKVGTIPAPTLRDWNKISGVVSYICYKNGEAKVSILVANAFPNALYTMWDVGARNPLTTQEQPYAVPLGGLPNVFLTDEKGCGNTTIRVPYCPGRPCKPGVKSCSAYLSIAHHWDQQIYGASPDGSSIGIPVGAYVGNHMVWPMSGEILQPPHTHLSSKDVALCSKK